jgi:putative transposase
VDPDRDRPLRDELRRLSRAHPRWGFRRAHALLREQGWLVNRKVVQRLWREEPCLPARRRKRQRLGTSTTPADRLAAERPDHEWALDYQFDQTLDGRRLKLLNVVDEHTRQALAIHLDRRIGANATLHGLDQLVAQRGTAPRFIRCDNSPELTANALRDWCRFNHAGTSYIEPGSPWQNPYVLRCPAARRTARRRGVQHPDRGTSAGRGQADPVQHHPTPQRPGYRTPTTMRKPGPPPA